MLTKRKSEELWERVKENHRKLAGCPGPHDFRPLDDRLAAVWYEKGLEHGAEAVRNDRG